MQDAIQSAALCCVEISPTMPQFSRPMRPGEKSINLRWATPSGTGLTLLYVTATNMVDAYARARAHFAAHFAPFGYELLGVEKA